MEKICVITGATSGIGKAAASLLLDHEMHLLVVARDTKKAKKFIDELEVPAQKKWEIIEGKLDSISDVYLIVKKIKKITNKIDLLINNAGIYTKKRQENSDGLEMQFMVNYLAPAILSRNLLALLHKSGDAKVINVSSRMHTSAKIDPGDMQMKKNYSPSRAYANTKLALIADTFYLANLHKDKQIAFLALHPGVYSTGITRELPTIVQKLWQMTIPGPGAGAKILLDLANSDPGRNLNGKYFFKTKEKKADPRCYDSDFQENLNQLYTSIINQKM